MCSFTTLGQKGFVRPHVRGLNPTFTRYGWVTVVSTHCSCRQFGFDLSLLRVNVNDIVLPVQPVLSHIQAITSPCREKALSFSVGTGQPGRLAQSTIAQTASQWPVDPIF